jgi:hypothetical protein
VFAVDDAGNRDEAESFGASCRGQPSTQP